MLRFKTGALWSKVEDHDIMSTIWNVLAILTLQGHDAVVGGGCLRDLENLGRGKIKDIDIFVPQESVSPERVMELFKTAGFSSRIVITQMAAEYLAFTDVSCVVECHSPNCPWPVQVIFLAKNCGSAEQVIERLDLGPCQIGMDHHGTVWRSPRYISDVAAQTMTVTRPGNDLGPGSFNDRLRSTTRFHRLSQKYPGWKLVGGL